MLENVEDCDVELAISDLNCLEELYPYSKNHIKDWTESYICESS